MGEILFISDVHLSPESPEIIELFQRFLVERAKHAVALYILGDLFDFWIGDDDNTVSIPAIIAALHAVSDGGTQLFVQRGNRDFLLGHKFARATGCQLLPDLVKIDLDGVPTLLMHGDLLCTDDITYQRFRLLVRNPLVKKLFLMRSLEYRRRQAVKYRLRSHEIVKNKPVTIMDVNQLTVEIYMRRFGVQQLIHGHTHLPGKHQFYLDGKLVTRWVLANWTTEYEQLYW